MVFFHLDVYYMSASVLKDLKKRWKSFREAVPITLFVMLTAENEANRRLVEMFGFKFLSVIPCTDGKERNLFVHFGPTNGGPQE